MIDHDIKTELKSVLGQNEPLLWTGRPKIGIIFRSTDAFLIPFSILWCGFAIFWESTAIAGGAPFFFMLWGIPFVGIGLYMVVGRFFIDARKRRNTIYAITPDRILIRSGVFNTEVTSLNIRTISDINFTQKSDGSGTIVLGPENIRQGRMMQGMEWPGVKQTPRLEMIEDAKKVYDIIIEQQRQR